MGALAPRPDPGVIEPLVWAVWGGLGTHNLGRGWCRGSLARVACSARALSLTIDPA